MAKGLLLTVGASAESEIFCIQQIAPEYVVFLCTKGSRRCVDLIVGQTNLPPSCFQIQEVMDTPDAAGALVMESHKGYQWLQANCGEGADIAINPTAGRKWMSMALGLFGSRSAARQVYVDVAFRDGKADGSTMKLVELGNPHDYLGLYDADAAVNLFSRGDFEGAAQGFDRISPKTAAARELYKGLGSLAESLHRWDRFEHYADSSTVSKAGLVSVAQVAVAAKELQLSMLKPFTKAMETFFNRIRQVETDAKPSLVAVVDLVQNAQRRLRAGRLDDGVARLYRALEATAQVLLHQKGINTSAVDWTKVSDGTKKVLADKWKLADVADLPEKTALVQSFELGHAMELPGVNNFINQQGEFCYKKHLSGRNESILAHGWKTLDRDRAEKFAAQLRADLQKLGADFSGWDIPPLPRLWT